MFSHNISNGQNPRRRVFRPVRQLAAPGAKSAVWHLAVNELRDWPSTCAVTPVRNCHFRLRSQISYGAKHPTLRRTDITGKPTVTTPSLFTYLTRPDQGPHSPGHLVPTFDHICCSLIYGSRSRQSPGSSLDRLRPRTLEAGRFALGRRR